jgi:hypothetical protein
MSTARISGRRGAGGLGMAPREILHMRKLAFAALATFVCFSLAAAEEFTGLISKVDGNKVTLKKFKRGEKGGEEVTLTAVESVKVVKGKRNAETKKLEAGDSIEGGLKNEMFSKGNVFATITTNDDGKITQVIAGGGKNRKKKDAN